MILSNILTMYKIKLNQLLIYLFFSIFFVSNLYTKPIKFEGLKKLSFNDLQAITEYQLSDKDFTGKTVNEVIKSFLNSNLSNNFNILVKFFVLNL